ncbi:MAG: hypothetical protein R3C68_09695 [Myxococcota bacterium]
MHLATYRAIIALTLASLFACEGSGGGSQKKDSCNQIAAQRCDGNILQQCDGSTWQVQTDCAGRGEECQEPVPGAFLCLAPGRCTSALAGQQRCGAGNHAEVCTGTSWVAATGGDCAASGLECAEASQGIAVCRNPGPGQDTERCGKDVQCDTGLTCQNSFIFGQRCLRSCGDDPNVCEPTQVCEPDASQIFGQPGVPFPACSTESNRGEFCFSDATCADGLRCSDRFFTSISRECKAACDKREINTASSCLNGETCFEQNRHALKYQDNGAGGRVPCKNAQALRDDALCDSINQYTCFLIGNPASEQFECARWEGVCGLAAPRLTDLSTSGISTFVSNALGATPSTRLCNSPNQDFYCAPVDGVRAECVSTPFAITRRINGAEIPCLNDTDCALTGASCLNSNLCGYQATACAVMCEAPDGEGGELTCPASETCVEQAHDLNSTLGDFIFQGGDTVSCADSNGAPDDSRCDQANGFWCADFGNVTDCLRGRKICVPQ